MSDVMSYLFLFLNAIKPAFVWYSFIVIILSVLSYVYSRSIFFFTMVFFIMIFIGYEYSIYPIWLLALSILDMIVFSVLEKTKILGVKL